MENIKERNKKKKKNSFLETIYIGSELIIKKKNKVSQSVNMSNPIYSCA